MITNNQRKDLREAWDHVYTAREELEKLPTSHPGLEGRKLTILQELSDATRLIDRVETNRAP